MITAQNIRFVSESQAISIKEIAVKANEALKVMSLLARTLVASKDSSPQKLATLKTSLKSLRDLISGAKLLTDVGVEADLPELFFGNPVAFTHVLDSEDHGFSWLLRAKNLLTVGAYNIALVQSKAENEISTFASKKETTASPYSKLVRRRKFEENVDFSSKLAS